MKHLVTACLFLLLPTILNTPASAATYNIADGDVSGLIAAINAANMNSGPDTINLAPSGTYTLTYIAGPDSWHGPTGLPIVQGSSETQRKSLSINGNGSIIQRSDSPGTPLFRIFHALYANVVLDGVVIKGGYGQGNRCGGGGLYLNVSNTVIRNSTITENFGFEGGGICNNNASTLTIENSTISHNTGPGGEINNHVASLSISNTTIYDDQPDSYRSDSIVNFFSPPGSIMIKNSIVASPTGGEGIDCYSFTPVSLGHNIFSDSTCGQNVAGGDATISNLVLGSLADNGGLTPTHALLSGSPAIDAIPVGDCTTINGVPVLTDQRGMARPFGLGCDIGAFEQSDTTGPIIAPLVSGPLGNDGWYTGDVTVNWDVSDTESDVSSSSGCDLSSVMSDTADITLICTATSSGGTSAESVTIKRDATAPEITINSPTNGTYLLNQTVSADFSCSDGLSGVASCSGSAAHGATLVTGTAGSKTFSVSASDNAGNSASATVNYTVGYSIVALFDQTKAYKSGNSVPIKLRLVDANSANVSSPSTTLHAVTLIQVSTQASTNVEDAGNANTDLDFRYDADFGGYIFNLKTTGLGTGSYLLKFTVGLDPEQYSVGFQVRR